MKDVRCLLGRHRFSEWLEVENHLERECLRCGHVEAKYPPLVTLLAKIASDLIWKYYLWETQPKMVIPPRKGGLKRSDNR